MKKTFLYSLAVLASVSLASCNGDYEDWAQPQHNPQEASAAKYGITFTAGPEAECNMPDEDGVINLVTVNSTDANVTGYTLKDLKVNGEAIKKGEIVGNNIQVDATELEKILCKENKTRASVASNIKVESKVSVNLASGDAVAINTVGETTGKITTSPTPAIDENGYYMLGKVNGNGWDATSPVWMNKVSDGVYQLKVTTEEDKNYFKFYEGSKWDESGDWKVINTGAMGCEKDGCEDASGTIYYTGDKWGTPQSMVIPGAGTWIVTLDMNNLSYSVGKPILYMKGDANGWDGYDYLTGDGVHFTGFMYLNQNGFKFTTAPDWSGTGYGENFSTAPDAGNIVMTEPAGYYKVDVDLSAQTYTLTPITSIGIIGAAVPVTGWDSDQDLTYNVEERCWEIKDIKLNAGECKFRANDDWAMQWGYDGEKFVYSNNAPAVQFIPEAGTYDIKLYAWANGYVKCEFTKK